MLPETSKARSSENDVCEILSRSQVQMRSGGEGMSERAVPESFLRCSRSSGQGTATWRRLFESTKRQASNGCESRKKPPDFRDDREADDDWKRVKERLVWRALEGEREEGSKCVNV